MYLASNDHCKVMRHRAQHVEAVSWSTDETAASEARAEKRRWQRDTCCALWTVSAVRAVGFLLTEAYSFV